MKPPIPHLFLCVSPLEFFDRVKGFLASSFTCRNDLVSHPVAEGAWVILEISQSGPTMLIIEGQGHSLLLLHSNFKEEYNQLMDR